jgi:uncharacterized repeat protein (TIGR01451 family)
MKRTMILIGVLAVLVTAGVAVAQMSASYRLERSVIAGGGAQSASANYQVAGTIGQSLASPPESSSARFQIWSGFWPDFEGQAHLLLTKTNNKAVWYAGWDLTYTIVITNAGSAPALDTRVTDTLPSGVYVTTPPAGATLNPDGSYSWALGDLGVGESRTLTLMVRTFSHVRGVVTNVVEALSVGVDPVMASDSTIIIAPPTTPTSTPSPTATATTAPTSTPTFAPTATSTPEPQDLELTGIVYGGSLVQPGFEPIAGARVAASLCIPAHYEAITDAQGRYTLTILAADANACAELGLVVSANGYQTLQQTFLIADLRQQPERDFYLDPLGIWRLWLPLAMRD